MQMKLSRNKEVRMMLIFLLQNGVLLAESTLDENCTDNE